MIVEIVRERGPMTVAAFMDLALYHPACGYYARAAQRSGRAGDFFTSVDVGPLFGELLAIQVAEMATLLGAPSAPLDLVEAGAGNGRLTADVLRAIERCDRELLGCLRVTVVEPSPAARAAQPAVLSPWPFQSAESLPHRFEGVLFANELLDALPVHQVVMREEGLREVYVTASGTTDAPVLETREGPLSTAALAAYLERLSISLEPGWRAEINLRAVDWIREGAASLERGFIMLIDYGHPAAALYSASHAAGTLTTFSRHTAAGALPDRSTPPWLRDPGRHDMTAHVDFTTVRDTAEAEGLTTVGFLDQTYFVLGLLPHLAPPEHPAQPDLAKPTEAVLQLNRLNLQLKTLLMPGGLGSTMKVLILGKNVGRPALRGCSYRVRVT